MPSSQRQYELFHLIQTIYNQGFLNPFISFIESQNRILIYLLRYPNAHPSNISDELNSSRSTIANCLKQLESMGYIERNINCDNRREIYVNITEKGKNYINSMISDICKLFDVWLNILGEEADHLLKILQISSNITNVDDMFYKFAEQLKIKEEE